MNQDNAVAEALAKSHVEALLMLLPLARMITLRQAVKAGIHEQLGWDAWALNEGADPDWPALSHWRAEQIEEALSVLKAQRVDEGGVS